MASSSFGAYGLGLAGGRGVLKLACKKADLDAVFLLAARWVLRGKERPVVVKKNWLRNGSERRVTTDLVRHLLAAGRAVGRHPNSYGSRTRPWRHVLMYLCFPAVPFSAELKGAGVWCRRAGIWGTLRPWVLETRGGNKRVHGGFHTLQEVGPHGLPRAPSMAKVRARHGQQLPNKVDSAAIPRSRDTSSDTLRIRLVAVYWGLSSSHRARSHRAGPGNSPATLARLHPVCAWELPLK